MANRIYRSRWTLVLSTLGLAAGATIWSQSGSLAQTSAKPAPLGKPNPNLVAVNSPQPDTSSDYSKRHVAYIFQTIPITREELGEYLIERMGADRLQNLVNKRIIDHVCKQKGIEVTAAEVEADLAETLKGLGTVTREQFVNTVLKPYQKTLYEWKEDVIKPRLLLTKLCQQRVTVTEEDLRNAHEAYHGEKVECRIIMWPDKEKNYADTMYPKIRDSEEEFERVSRTQADHKLAANAGWVAPFGRHTTGYEELEKTAFNLRPGELSHVIGTKQGHVVIKCIARKPPDGKTLDQVRQVLERDIIARKISQIEIPKLFSELRAQADPQIFLKNATTDEDLRRDVRKEIQSEAAKPEPARIPRDRP